MELDIDFTILFLILTMFFVDTSNVDWGIFFAACIVASLIKSK